MDVQRTLTVTEARSAAPLGFSAISRQNSRQLLVGSCQQRLAVIFGQISELELLARLPQYPTGVEQSRRQ